MVDKTCDAFRNTRRWPMVIFYSILNVAGISTFIIFFLNKNFPEGTKPGALQRTTYHPSDYKLFTSGSS
jgi:hypothetical protein